MDMRNKSFWLSILIAIPIGIIINLITQLLNVQISISIGVISIIGIVYYIFSDRIINWLTERTRQSRARAAKELEDALIELEELRNDLPTLVTRVAWDILVFQTAATAVVTLGLITWFVVPVLPGSLKQGLFLGMFIGFLFSLISELRKLRYIRNLHQFDKYKKEAKAKIVQLTQRGLEIVLAKYGIDGQEIDVTEHLKRQITNDALSCKAGNGIAGDPVPGTPKRLLVEYVFDGKRHAIEVKEGDMLSLPAK